MPVTEIEEVETALAYGIALGAHAGQVDWNDEPYIKHVLRVAHSVKEAGKTAYGRISSALPMLDDVFRGAVQTAVTVALLHDVIEDTPITLDQLTQAGFRPHVVEAVDLLTHREGQSNPEFWAQIKPNSLASIVKRADWLDNSEPARLAQIVAGCAYPEPHELAIEARKRKDRLTKKYADMAEFFGWTR